MTNGYLLLVKHVAYLRGKVEQAHHISNDGAGFAYMLGNGFLLHAELFLQEPVLFCLFQRCEVGALKVFNKRQLCNLLVSCFMHYNLDRGHSQPGDSAQAAFTGDELECTADLAYHKRLNEASFAYGGCKFFNLFFVKAPTRLERGSLDISDIGLNDTVSFCHNAYGRMCRRLLLFHDEGAQPLS